MHTRKASTGSFIRNFSRRKRDISKAADSKLEQRTSLVQGLACNDMEERTVCKQAPFIDLPENLRWNPFSRSTYSAPPLPVWPPPMEELLVWLDTEKEDEEFVPKGSFPMLDLPPELRAQIYDYLIPRRIVSLKVRHSKVAIHRNRAPLVSPRPQHQVALLRACKQLSKEASSTLYEKTSFAITIKFCEDPVSCDPMYRTVDPSSMLLRNMRHAFIRVCTDHTTFFDPLANIHKLLNKHILVPIVSLQLAVEQGPGFKTLSLHYDAGLIDAAHADTVSSTCGDFSAEKKFAISRTRKQWLENQQMWKIVPDVKGEVHMSVLQSTGAVDVSDSDCGRMTTSFGNVMGVISLVDTSLINA